MKISTLAVLGMLCLQACNKINPTEPIPTYIHIETFRFKPAPSIRTDSLITLNAVWAYYNNNNIGVFDLPVTFPVIATGVGKLQLYPAVAVNGLNNFQGVYPWYTPDTFSFAAQPGTAIDHQPVTSYAPATRFHPISYFVSADFTRLEGNANLVIAIPDSLKYNNGATGGIFLNNPGDSAVVYTTTAFKISADQNYIEFDYKCSVPFTLSLKDNLSLVPSEYPTFLAGVNPTTQWKKFYLYVSDFAAQTKGIDYTLYIKTVLPKEKQNGMVLLANMQLLSAE